MRHLILPTLAGALAPVLPLLGWHGAKRHGRHSGRPLVFLAPRGPATMPEAGPAPEPPSEGFLEPLSTTPVVPWWWPMAQAEIDACAEHEEREQIRRRQVAVALVELGYEGEYTYPGAHPTKV